MQTPLIAGVLALGHLLTTTSAARQPYDVHKIIDAFRHPHDDLVILCAHRGSRWNGTAENSRAAFFRSTQSGLECIETDIRMSADGHLMMIHDEGIGRVTDVGEYTSQAAYNPFTGQGYNPKVHESDLSGFMEHLHLRDEGGRVQLEKIPTLADTIHSIHSSGANIVLQLDFKNKEDVPAAYHALKSMSNAAGVPANEWCIYKTRAVWWKTPDEFEAQPWVQDAFANNISLSLLPVYHARDTWKWDTIASLKAFQATNYTISAEIEMRSTGAPLQKELDFVLASRKDGNASFDTAGVFFAIGEFVKPISTAFFDTANFTLPADERVNNSVYVFHENRAPTLRKAKKKESIDGHDHRSDFNWILRQGYSWVIADTPDVWHERLQKEGKRNLTHMIADGREVADGARGWYV